MERKQAGFDSVKLLESAGRKSVGKDWQKEVGLRNVYES